MIEIERLLHHVLPFAPECPEPTAIHHLREATIQFCERTRIWRHELTISTADPLVIVTPAGSRLFEIEDAWFNGTRLERVPVNEAADYVGDSPGVPRWITEYGETGVRLVPFDPADPGELRISAFLTPSRDATEIPDFLVDGHARTIADGALSDLLMLPNQPFSNPALAAGFGVRFEAQINRNFAANIRGRQRAPTRSKPHWL